MKDNVQRTVISPKLAGGPHGLGDPDDTSLRKVEKDVLITQLMRDKAKENCHEVVEEFSKCCVDNSFLMVVRCRKQNSALKSCLVKWFNDEKFKEECTQEYLNDRREYRLTGIPKKSRQKKLPSS
ncbi:COX assembly mitochondrial protein homolog [Nomia melanderi]|uniref:COX assembly mitochondrial protein homolog n=1 Tax=Nomia melanderi TaxID=2448451 RepID=UPI00130468B1|nr:COX assembly mitochondrial protein homolog [Nomia melanderi]